MKIFCIPNKLETYEENNLPPPLEDGTVLIYKVEPHEFVEVTLWERYPSYDFIFGVPMAGSKRYKREIGFFLFRHFGGKQIALWFDVQEYHTIFNGFRSIFRRSTIHSPHLWEQYGKDTTNRE